MADQADVRRIASSLPDTSAEEVDGTARALVKEFDARREL